MKEKDKEAFARNQPQGKSNVGWRSKKAILLLTPDANGGPASYIDRVIHGVDQWQAEIFHPIGSPWRVIISKQRARFSEPSDGQTHDGRVSELIEMDKIYIHHAYRNPQFGY